MSNVKRVIYDLKQARKLLAVSYIAVAKGYEWCPDHFEKDNKTFHGSDIVTPNEVRLFDEYIDNNLKPEDAAIKVIQELN
tara:strand:+ start:139 stop:378 length:240 start_codon:yes stop_codon:yes gene_type:complete